jgi:L-ascorbate metabolism protein UlaG (beta-lactamase superfamily)
LTVSVKLLGHASFKMNIGDKVVYVDPYEGEYAEKADLVLITHSHSDHCDESKIGKIRKRDTVFVAPADCASKVGKAVKTLRPGETLSVGDIKVQAVEAYNIKRFRSPGNPFHPKGLGVGYLVTVAGKTIYHAGDTDFILEMKSLHGIYLALLPVGGTYTMDCPEAAEAAFAIGPDYVIPMHRREANLAEFKKTVEGKSKTKVVLLAPGETFEVK